MVRVLAPPRRSAPRWLAVLAATAALLSGCSQANASSPRLPTSSKPHPTSVTPPSGAKLQFKRLKGPAVVGASMWSTSLHRVVHLVVYVPPGYNSAKSYPVLYLLHGVPGNAPIMVEDLNLKSTLDRMISSREIAPMIVVAPSDGPLETTDTEWENSPIRPKWKWASLVAEDLVSWTQSSLPACPTRTGRAIGGLSMGAFGAINIALHYLDVFGSATLWSPYFIANTPSIEGPKGSQGWWDNSPLLYLPSMISALRRMPLRISYYSSPKNPGFYAQSLAFAKILTRNHIPFRFLIGGHSWPAWRSHFPSEMLWLSKDFHC